LGVNPSLVHFWLQGECAPRQELFERLCGCLDIAPQEIAPNGLTMMSRISRNPLTLWLEDIGLWGLGSHEKFIPEIVFRLTKTQLALFLNRLFATDSLVIHP
jgi:replicative DNA helicase